MVTIVSKLIQMRRRIKAIETIKKVTHAMRLISMSTHSRLKNKQHTLTEYVTAVENLFNDTIQNCPDWINPVLAPTSASTKTLLIVVGSQKGLCGNFNNALFNRFTAQTDLTIYQNNALIAVGKKASDELKKIAPHALIDSYEHFTTQTFLTISHKLIEHITTATVPYAKVAIWSNEATSFFLQKPTETVLIPFKKTAPSAQNANTQEDYIEEYPTGEILNILAKHYLEAHIERLLFESLLAEQAARFISMDGSTRNANNLLEETQLQYNKFRQAKITKELTELIGSF